MIKAVVPWLLVTLGCALLSPAEEDFPFVADDIEISLFARDPLVRNPCAMAFDAQGRLCVGLGPQYRNPSPNTPGDSVFILIDQDGNGVADRRKEFATGFNAIQGLAWKGSALWVANSPELTVVRDVDGDDQADEYIRLYTDLGNLEHALHGLNWAPDGKLYMSKGNSKGVTQPPDRLAPKPFRQLWGVDQPDLPEFPQPLVFNKGEYRKNYHDPDDDWGREGGILRCDPDGTHLEIVSRGFRNPWDITFDDTFTWLGTDNDQTMGDKIFTPFYGAHFGWGHPWSFDWKGDDHLPTAPSSGPLFEGSGTGIIYCNLVRYPERYRGVFLINDWLRREVFVYRPAWNGARRVPQELPFARLGWAGRGRSLNRSEGVQFDPVDVEIGADEAIYISSWGRDYGARFEGGQMQNEGRIYRLWPKSAPPLRPASPKRSRPLTRWSTDELLEDLGSHLPVWRVNAQDEFIRRGTDLEPFLRNHPKSQALETWTAWTLGRTRLHDGRLDSLFAAFANSNASSLNLRLQSLRILAYRRALPDGFDRFLESPEPRIRFEALLAMHQCQARTAPRIIDLLGKESDRLVYYAAWHALGALLGEAERKSLLTDARAGVRRGALLSLLEEDALDTPTLQTLVNDTDASTAALALRRLNGKSEAVIRGKPLLATREAVQPKEQRPAATSPASVDQVLELLPTADSARGSAVFFGQPLAGCTACHHLDGTGNTFAPDLSGIGKRANADFIARSIIDPSATVTEGFVTHTFELGADESYSGILLEETGLGFKLALADGSTVTLPRARVRKHQTSRMSPMPANYAELLNARQVADLTAFLLTRTNAALEQSVRSKAPFTVQLESGQLRVLFGNVPVATYVFQHPELKRPAFVNVCTASGVPVTRPFPASANADHRYMHPGIAMSFGWLDGNDYWRFKAKVEHAGFLEEPRIGNEQLTWAVQNRYLSEDGNRIVCFEHARYSMAPDPDGFVLKIDSTFLNDERDFCFGDQEESGLCLRVADPLTVKSGNGTITNDRGETNESGTWGREFGWIDYSGLSGSKYVGMLLVPHPENPRTCWSHSRDYGVIVANPFPRQPQERREPYVKTWVKKGERYRLQFSLLVYEAGLGK